MHGGDNYVSLLRTVTAATLEVYLLQQCNVANLRVLANCCVWYGAYTPVEITLRIKFLFFRILYVFLFTLYMPPTSRRVEARRHCTS